MSGVWYTISESTRLGRSQCSVIWCYQITIWNHSASQPCSEFHTGLVNRLRTSGHPITAIQRRWLRGEFLMRGTAKRNYRGWGITVSWWQRCSNIYNTPITAAGHGAIMNLVSHQKEKPLFLSHCYTYFSRCFTLLLHTTGWYFHLHLRRLLI